MTRTILVKPIGEDQVEDSRILRFHVTSSLTRNPVFQLRDFGASIPVEALADSPGMGQLAWRAALGRDIPLLVSITLLLTAVTTAANLLSDIAMLRAGVRAA